MNFVNLTPHAVRLRADTTNTAAEAAPGDIVVEPTKPSARVGSTSGALLGDASGIALYGATQFGEVEGLPAPQEGTIYLVSILVAGRVSDRSDVFAPGTGPADGAVRFGDGPQKGQIFAVTRLIQAG